MGLIKRAPKVQVYAPQALFVGRPCDVDIVIEAEDEVDVAYVDVSVVGDQGWSVGAGKSRATRRESFPELATRLMGEGTLPVGTTRLPTRFTLPAGTPPTHDLRPAWATLELMVHVSTPWWPDVRHRVALPARLPPPAAVDRRPTVFRSNAANGDPDARRLEVSLASTVLIAGETVVGSCAVFHVDDRKPREVEIALVPRLELSGWRNRERDATGLCVTFMLPAGRAGTDAPFRFNLPASITPSFQTLSHRLQWVLVARTGSFFGGHVEVTVPVVIVDASAAEMAPQLAPAPRLADARVAQIFEEIAVRDGWRQVAAGRDGDVAIERAVGDSVARLTYTYRAESGTFVVSTVEHPSLGLDLVVTPSASLRHVFFEDIEVDIAEWDRGHHVVARAAEQAIPLLEQAVPALLKTSRLGSLVRWCDDAIVFERAIASIEEPELAVIGATLGYLAAAIAAATHAIPPPPALTVDASAWRELAAWLDGRLSIGDLSIDGTLDRVRVALGLAWRDGRALGIRASVGDPDAAGGDVRGVSFVLARPREDVMATRAAEALVEQVIVWPADVVELRVHDGVASALWLLPDGAAPIADAARVRSLVERLRAVLVALAPGAGPYR